MKSRGVGADEADNLFPPSAYYTSADLEGVDYATAHRMSLEQSEFGAVPDQLFVLPHACRGSGEDDGVMWKATVKGDAGGREGRGKTPVKAPVPTPDTPPATVMAPGSPGVELSAPVEGMSLEPMTPKPNTNTAASGAPPAQPPLNLQSKVALAKGEARAWLSNLGFASPQRPPQPPQG